MNGRPGPDGDPAPENYGRKGEPGEPGRAGFPGPMGNKGFAGQYTHDSNILHARLCLSFPRYMYFITRYFNT